MREAKGPQASGCENKSGAFGPTVRFGWKTRERRETTWTRSFVYKLED